MHGSSGEQSSFAWGEIGRDEMGAVLLPHVRGGISHGGNDVIGSTRMKVGWQHAAGSEVDHSHYSEGQLWLGDVQAVRLLVKPFLRPAAKVAAFMLVTPPGAQL